VMLYLRAIRAFERARSVPKAFIRIFVPKTAMALIHDIKFAVKSSPLRLSVKNVPKDVLFLNTFVTAVYGIGIVSAAYASVLHPQAARTALLSSGLVNGLATIAYNVFVDPVSAFITDQSVRGERSIDDVKALVTYLSFTAILGFLLSQLLLVPGATVIEFAAKLITGR
jgi:Alternate to MurJ